MSPAERLLRSGRPVRPPAETTNLPQYIQALAVRAGVRAEGSYLTARRPDTAPAAAPDAAPRPALELLAEAITGKDIALEAPEGKRWCLNYSDDPKRTVSYAASGGLITRIDTFSRREGSPNIWTLARTWYDQDVAEHVVATRMEMEVLGAVNARGADCPAEKLAETRRQKAHWTDGQQAIYLDKEHFGGDRIGRLRVRGKVAMRTGTAVFTFETLGHKEPVTMRQGDVTVTVLPLRAAQHAGQEVWELPVQVRTAYEKPRDLSAHSETIAMFGIDGKEFRSFGRWGRGCEGGREVGVRIQPHTIDPGSTRMVFTYPSGLKIVPYELTFTDVRIKDVPPRRPSR
jgi:hypothetical protein